MKSSSLTLTIATAALAVGIMTDGAHQSDHPPLAKSDILIVENDADTAPGTEAATDDSAKMGKEEGTHTGSTMGATEESDTKKVEQPERTNPTTGDADTPSE